MSFDDDTNEFLKTFDSGTRDTYTPALKKFQEYLLSVPEYRGPAPLKIFLDRVSEDQDLPKRERKRVARNTLRSYIQFLTQKGKEPKTVHTYITAVQSLASYFEIEITTKFLNMPKAKVATKSYAWLPETIAKFAKALKEPMYQAIHATFYQSGLSIVDTLDLSYADIKKEFEAGTVPLFLDFTEKGRHKTQVEFRSFLAPEALELLKRHFAINGAPSQNDKIFQISDRAVQAYYRRRALDMLGSWDHRNPMSPHSIRKAFRKMIVNAGCPESYAEYFMGHDLDADLRKIYTEMTTEEWRLQYKKRMNALSFKLPPVN